ncbi:MAG: HDOD domain-containing protein [Desulfofustis sp.]|nr:HDOD domain-containing protein [Desulfofustis sp.]
MSTKETVFNRIKESGHVPVLPEILVRLLEACDNQATPLTQVASLIDKDPSLSYKVLQLVNSAYFGLKTTYSGVDQAVVYLGVNSVKNMAVTAAVHQVFNSERFNNLKYFNIHTFWHHSLKCACLARRLAELTGQANPDDAYLGGLLHDLGKLVLVSAYPEQYEAVLADSPPQEELLEAEQSKIGAQHADIGAWLVADWKLNPLIGDAISYHHEDPQRVTGAFPLVKIVYSANELSKDGNQEVARGVADLLLGVDGEDLKQITEAANEEILQISAELGITVEAPSPEEGDAGRTVIVAEDGATLHANLASRIKGIALLSGFLENMSQAEDNEAMIKAFEQSLQVLFGFDRTVLLMPDRDEVLLTGRASASNKLRGLSLELILPIQKSSSCIVKAYQARSLDYLKTSEEQENLADRQIISAFGCRVVAVVPLSAEMQEVGVALIGLPESMTELSTNDHRLLKTICQQAAMCLYLDELKARKAEDIETERQAAISMTARKFAHEVNNPLGIIHNYLTTLKLKVADEDNINRELGIISEEINRISAMINQLDTFAQASFSTSDLTNVNNIISDIVQLVKSSLLNESATEVSFNADPELPLIKTSPDGIKQIVINLLKNSSEAMGGTGQVVVTTSRSQRIGSEGQGEIIIRVEDNGPGLPETVKDNLFTPFISTKGIGHSGLGLSIVKKAVADLGGTIECTSESKRGTVFEIGLPISNE